MKGMTLAVLAVTILLHGCAATDAVPNGQNTVADRSEPTLGSYIKRKSPGSGPGNVSTMDKQALENERTMNNAGINVPQR